MATPTAHHLIDAAQYDAVGHDRLPRAARYRTDYDDGTSGETIHVLYWDGLVRSMLDSDWIAQRGALPTPPTPAESAAAVAALAQAAAQAQVDAAQLRQQVLAIAQSAVGVRVDALTTVQLRALFAAVLWKAGALNADLTIRPLGQWVDR